MSKAEVENLSDEDLKSHWQEITLIYKMGTQNYLSKEQSLILFADFVNVSSEMDKRKITTHVQIQ